MSCIYKYKGKDYTKEEFYSLVSSSNFTQQEQAKKFAELQERLNNKEFLEGAKNAFESSEELQNVYYEATGFVPKMINREGQEYFNNPRIRFFVKIADEVRASLPGVKEGYTRLYRGNRPSDLKSNPQFTNSLEGIALPFLMSYEGQLSYIDVPTSDLSKYVQKGGVASNAEFIVTSEIAKNATPIDNTIVEKYKEQYPDKLAPVEITPQQKQQALNAYTDYIARVSLGIIKNPSSGEYNYESHVKDIVYHFSNVKIDKPNKEKFSLSANINRRKGFFGISKNINPGNNFANVEGSIPHAMLFNMKNPDFGDFSILPPVVAKDKTKDSAIIKQRGDINYYSVFEPEQIHILGSEQDIEGFKSYVNNKSKFLTQENNNSVQNTYTNHITYSQALEKARQLLPNFKQEDLEFITKEAMFGETGRTDVMGMYRKGSIFIIDKNGKGTIEEYILRHELFHKIFTEYLTKEEQQQLFNSFNKEFGATNIAEFEEQLTLKFQHWKNTGSEIKHSTLRKLFNKILRFLGLLKANTSSINEFFKQVENQTFSIKKQSAVEQGKFISEIKQKFSHSETMIDGKSSDYLQNFKKLTTDFLRDNNRLSEGGLYFDTKKRSKYIITGHNEIKKLILGNLQAKIDQYNKQIVDLRAQLEKDKDNQELVNQYAQAQSERRFALFYEKQYDFIREQMFPNSLMKFKKDTSNLDYLFLDDAIEEDETTEEEGKEYEKGQAFSFQEGVYDSFSKTSTKVKTILSNVYDEQRGAYLSWGESYKIALELLNDLPAHDLNKWEGMLKSRTNLYSKSSFKAVVEKILFLKKNATLSTYSDNKGVNQVLPENGKFLNLDKGELFLLVFDPSFDISKIEREEDIDIYLKEGEYIKVKKEDKQSTKAFLQTVSLELEDVEDHDVEEFIDNFNLLNALRVKQYNNQALTELLQNITSQKENNRLIGTKDTNEKGTEYRYFSALKDSIEQSVNTDIIDKLSSRFETSKQVKEFTDKYHNLFLDSNGKRIRDRRDKLEAVKKVLDALGFSTYNYDNINDYNVDTLYNSLTFLLFGEGQVSSKISIVGKDQYAGQMQYQETIQNVLSNEGSTITAISKFLRHTLQSDRPGMSKKADGKMVYNYTPSSNGMDIYRRLSQNNYLNSKKNPDLPYESGYEYLQTDYFKNNPFNPFTSDIKRYIHDVYIHDGIIETSTYGKNKSIEVYTKEDLSGFINRTFNMGFLTKLNSSTEGIQYIQFSSPVSNRPNIPGVLLDLLSNTEANLMIESLLKQIVSRPDYKDIQGYDRNKLVNLDKIANALKDISKTPKYAGVYKSVEVSPNKFEDRFFVEHSHITDAAFLNAVKTSFRNQIARDAEILFKQMIENQVTFSSTFEKNGLIKAYEVLANSNKDYLDTTDVKGKIKQIEDTLGSNRYFETWSEVKQRYAKDQGQTYESKKILEEAITIDMLREAGYEKQYKINDSLKNALLPLFQVYLQNDYLNSYFLDQINMGGAEYFKGSVDRVKRRQGAYSPGLKGFVNDTIGMSKHFHTAVIEDPTRKLSKNLSEKESENKQNYLYRLLVSTGIINKNDSLENKMKVYRTFVNKFDKFNPSDAQGYMLPERASELQKGFGESYQIGNVLKPAHYEIDALGIPRMVKYSAIVLTDNLVKDFPQLANLRDKMRNAKDEKGEIRPIGEIVYQSAFKVGAPKNRLGMKDGKFSEEEFSKLFSSEEYSIAPESVVKLSNERYKLQLNPEHELESHVAKPTQLFYFLKILNSNLGEATSVYDSLAKIMDIELKDFRTKYINDDNTFKVTEFIKYLTKKGAASETEIYHEILAELYNEQAVRSGKNPKPWNFPGIEDKIVTQFSSSLQNDIVQTKFKGTKLVLMSQVGATMAGKERLQYKKDEQGNIYAEVYLPKNFLREDLEKEIQEKGYANLFYLPELLGFRIPSSEIHSAVPMRIVGFHDLDSNVIIAPEEIVPLHGSDFDVDALFAIMPEVYASGKNTNDKLYREGFNNLPIGYVKQDGLYVFQSEEEFLNSLNTVEDLIKRSEMTKAYYKNSVTNTIIKVTSSAKNRERMISPISMKRLGESIDHLFEINKFLDPSGQIDESSAIDKQKVHSSSMNGRDGTGIFANFAKGLAYTLHTSSNTESPLLLKQEENLPYFTSSVPLNTLHDVINVWEDLDSLLNAAIDNVKEQALPKLNLNGVTIPTYAMMLGLGVEFDTANLIMVQPIIKHLSSISGKDKSTSKGVISATNVLKRKFRELNKESLTSEQLRFVNEFISNNFAENNLPLSNEELLHSVSPEVISSANITISDINDIEVLISQAKVLENYKRTEAIVVEFNKIVRYLSIVRDMPVFSNKIYELIDLKNQIWDDNGTTQKGFPINVDNFFTSNPHIAKSDEVLMLQKELLQKNFFKHSEKIKDFFTNLNHLSFDVNSFSDIKYKQDEFVKFVYSSLYFTKKNNSVVPFNYKIRNFKSERELVEQEAFVQHFVNKIRILKDIIPENYFVKRFSSLDLGYSPDLKRLAFYLDSKITPLDKAEYESAFSELSAFNIEDITKEEYDKINNKNLKRQYGGNHYRIIYRDLSLEQSRDSDLQREFVQYNILTEGMRNSSSSYSQLLPGYIYREQYYSYENLMNRIINDKFSLEELSNLFNVFNTNITLNNADKMMDFRQAIEFKSSTNYVANIEGQEIYFDISTKANKNADEYIKIKHPVYKKNFKTQEEFEDESSIEDKIFDNASHVDNEEEEKPDYYQTKIYKKVYSTEDTAYYQTVALVKNNKVYKSNSEIFSSKDNSSLYNRFAPEYYHVKYSNIEGNKIVLANEANANFLVNHIFNNVPSLISFSEATDNLRLDVKFGRVVEFDQRTRTVTFEEVAEKPPVPLITETIGLKTGIVTVKSDADNKNPILFNKPTQTLEEVLNNFDKFADPLHYALYQELKPFIKLENTTVLFNQKLRGATTMGYWKKHTDGTFTIRISEKTKTQSELSWIFLHELLHHVVYDSLHKNENLLTTNQKEAKRRLESLYNAAKAEGKREGKNSKNTYGLTNLDEFVSEAFSNKKFQEWLSSKIINKKSLWTRFKDAVSKILGIDENTMLYDVINTTLVLVSENSSQTDLKDSEVELKGTIARNIVEPFVEIRNSSEKIGLKLDLDAMGMEKDFYSSNVMNFERSTNNSKGYHTWFVEGYNFNKYKEDPITFEADNIWTKNKKKDDEEIWIPSLSKNVNKEDYIKERKEVLQQAQIRGKMAEALFNFYLTQSPEKHEEVNNYIKQLPPEVAAKVLVLDDWESIRKIVFNKMESNILNGDGSKMDFSIPTFSKALKHAGTIDVMIRNKDGEYSLFDMKTSQFAFETDFTRLFKFGDTHENNIFNTSRNRAKLQIMFYALMVKLNNPNAKFKKLSILHLPVTSSKTRFQQLLDKPTGAEDTVEVASYLEMIQSFLTNKVEQIELGLIKEDDLSLYEQLEKEYKENGGVDIKDLFNYKNYTNQSSLNSKSTSRYGQELLTAKSLEEKILQEISLLSASERDDLKIAKPTKDKIKINRYGEETEIDSLEKHRKIRLKELIEQWVKLTGDSGLNYLSTKDIDLLHLTIGSNKDVDNNPVFATWNKFKVSRQQQARNATLEKINLMLSKESKAIKKGLPINFRNQRSIFGKFIKKEYVSSLGREVERLVHKNKGDIEYDKLSTDEKAYVDYMNDVFASYFAKDSYLNSTGSFYVDQFGNVEGQTHLQAYNKGKDKFEYYEGWFPKTPITLEEYQEKTLAEAGAVQGAKSLLKNWAEHQLTKYFENLFNINEDTAAIPIKYLGNAEIEEKQLYSVKLDQVFEKFVQAMENKIHLDDVYHTGRSLTLLLEENNDLVGAATEFDVEANEYKKKYSNLIKFIKGRIEYEIKDNPITKTEWLTKEMIVGDKKIDLDKSMLLASQGAVATVMWLKPISGIGNALMGNVVKYKEALKFSIGKRIISDLQAKEIDYTFKDALFGEQEVLGLFKDSMVSDKIHSNKLFLIAEKFGYLADNYRFGSNARRFRSDRNPLLSSDNMYIFHTIGEKYLSYTTLAAQLKHYTVKVDGKDIPIYDLYDVEPVEPGSKYNKLVWKGPKRKIKKGELFEEVDGITDDEMYRFKAVSARMQGDYRREEFIELERYALGKITIVLKKFFPRLILNGIVGKTKSRALGWYEEVEHVKEDGTREQVLEWNARDIEGKWRTLFGAIGAILRINDDIAKAGGFPEYWKSLSHEQQLNLIDVIVTATIVLVSYVGFALMFNDTDDDDTLKKAYKNYLIDNTSQQYNFIDLLRTSTTIAQPVLVRKAFDFATSGTQLFFANGFNYVTGNPEDMYTKDDNLKGLNTFLKSVPYTAFGQDFYNKVKNINVDQYSWFNPSDDRYRN